MGMNISIEQLHAVISVAEHQSFSRAAESTRTAQSSLSRTVAQVERLTGVVLFERTTRRVRLTPHGSEFVQVARRIIADYEYGLRQFEGYLAGDRGRLRVAVLPSLAATLIPQLVTRFRQSFPEVLVEVEDVLAEQIALEVSTGNVDLALTASTTVHSEPPQEVHGLIFDAFASDTFHCVVPVAHRFAERSVVTWEEMADESFIAFDESSSVRRLVDSVFSSLHVEPARQITARNVASVAGLCAAGLGVSAAPGFVLPLMSFAEVTFVPLAEPEVRRHVGVLWDERRPLTPTVGGFRDVLRVMAAEDALLPPGAKWTVPTA